MRRYSEDHVWVLAENGNARVGVSDFAQKELGEAAYVELPVIGTRIRRGDVLCSIDSLKSAGEIYSPVSGIVTEVNSGLAEDCGLVNADPLGRGWIAVIGMTEASELDSLLSEEEYAAYISGS